MFKVPLIVLDAIGMRITSRPPPRPHSSEKLQPIVPDWREAFLRSLALPCILLRCLSWLTAFIEILVIVADYSSPHPFANYIIRTTSIVENCPQRISIPASFLVGVSLALLGTLIRILCYQSLGQLFTFELSIQPGHKLIVTGPYSIVRHPSYTGMILTIIGTFCSNFHGSWIAECGVLGLGFGKMLVVYWTVVASAVILSLLLRIPNEDELLKRQFGKDWELWASQVPYRLVPGFY